MTETDTHRTAALRLRTTVCVPARTAPTHFCLDRVGRATVGNSALEKTKGRSARVTSRSPRVDRHD